MTPGRVFDETRVEFESYFPGIDASPWTPPDPAIAVGPNHIVQTVNMEIAFFTKAGALTFQQTLDDTGNPGFFESVGAGDFCFDPKCYYDHYSNRFFVLALEVYTNTAFITFAVSDDDDPNGIWYKYRTDAVIQVGNTTYWVDYPGMGFDQDGFYVTGNLFRLQGNGSGFAGALFRSYDKTPLLSGGTASYTDIRDGSTASVQVAQCFGNNIAPFFVARESSSQLRIFAIENAFNNPQLVSRIVSVPNGNNPPNAPNGSGGSLSVVGSRIMNVHWRDGHLYTCNTVDVSNRAVARWYEFDTGNWPNSGLPTLTQSGDINLGSGNYTFFPAIYSNTNDSVAMVFAKSRNNEFASVQAVGRTSCDPAGQMSSPTEFEIGSATANGRWGDYFDIALDPADNNTFWVVGQIQDNGGWQCVINSFSVPLDFAEPTSFNVFRGVQVGGDLADALASDDNYLSFNPGFVLNQLEAPVWLVFNGTINGSADCFDLLVESNANTTGLTLTAEMFNWNTNAYEEVGSGSQSFNTDTVQTFDITNNHVSGGNAVQARIGWRKTGFTLLFPWTVNVDQVGWQP